MAEAGRRMPIDRELARTWQGVLGRLQFDVSPHSFATWLQPTAPLGFDGDTLLVRTPHGFHLDWLQQQFTTVLRRALIGELGRDVDLRFVGDGAGPAAGATSVPASAPPPGVSSSFTFANYLPAAGNELALRACRDLSGLGEVAPISPVVVFGTPGVGKSHLLHATANCAIERGEAVVFMTGEEFANGYQDAIRATAFAGFRDRVRCATLFILDDLQYLAGKKGTLEQLQQTIDAVRNRGGRVLVASELHPRSLGLPESLASRLAEGLVVGLGEILAGERRAFVELTARVLRASMPPWCVDRIAALPSGSARVLKGAVHTAVNLDRCGSLDIARLDAELTRIVVTSTAPSKRSAAEIIEAVARCYETTPEELCGRSRKGSLPEARTVVIAMLVDSGKSLSRVGALLDGRDPSTVSPLVEKGRLVLVQNPELSERLAG